jgi:NAD(P)H dehydrogenase (quinone)
VRTLVVSAHPPSDAFGVELVATAVAALGQGGHDVRTIDLDGYEPRMGAEEWTDYRDLAPRPSPLVAAHIADVRWAEQLVFVYPTRWQGLPAVLKGWLERTMVPGVAFEVDASGQLHGGLEQLRRIVGMSTHPLPRWTLWLLGDPGRRTISRALRLSCAHPWRARCRWLALHRPHRDQRRARDRAGRWADAVLASGRGRPNGPVDLRTDQPAPARRRRAVVRS